MLRCYSYTIIRERINLCLQKLLLLNSPLLPNSAYTNKDLIYGSHTTTVLTTHRCILLDHFRNCNFSKHKLMRSLMMV